MPQQPPEHDEFKYHHALLMSCEQFHGLAGSLRDSSQNHSALEEHRDIIMQRRARLAILTIPTLGHFVPDIVARLPAASHWDVRQFVVTSRTDVDQALNWTNEPDADSLWFEFCWPPFPALIDATDFAGRRIIVRIHRIEATETAHVAETAWAKVHDVIVVSPDMHRRVLSIAPELGHVSRLHIVPNGVDVERFKLHPPGDRFQIGWCGLMTLRKNPSLALQILHKLRGFDSRYRLNLCGMGGDEFASMTFSYLADQFGLKPAIRWDGCVAQSDMPGWHAQNGTLLHTSLHESFGYAIAEAAAVGCDLAIADHPGAHETWPRAAIFRSIDEAVDLIRHTTPARWRDVVADNYSIEAQIRKLAGILDRAVVHA